MTKNQTKTLLENKCGICEEMYIGYGNNADPVIGGKCCDKCNFSIVIPTRLGFILNKE